MPTVNPVDFVYDDGAVAYEDFRLYFNTGGIEKAEQAIVDAVEQAGCADERVYGYVTFREHADGRETYSVHFDATIDGIIQQEVGAEGDGDEPE